jgi:hypothetical protein
MNCPWSKPAMPGILRQTKYSFFTLFPIPDATEGNPMKKWLLAIALSSLVGCANPMVANLNNGTFCNAANVEAYAKRYNLTYEQALAELRKKSDALWAEQEAKQNSQAKLNATVVPATAPKTPNR